MFKNLELKILAIFSAIILWFFVVGIENAAYHFPEDIQVHAINVPENLTLTTELGKAKLRIRADQSLLKSLNKSDFDVYVDLKDVAEGATSVPIHADSKNEKVTILKVDPSTLAIELEPVSEKEVPIKSVLSGSPQNGYTVKDVIVDHQTVVLKGGKEMLRKIEQLTAPLQLNGTQSTNFQMNVPLQMPDGSDVPESLTIDPIQVRVDVTILPEFQQKTVVVKPVLKGTGDLGSATLQILPLTVAIQGKEDILNTISFLETETLSIEKLLASTKALSVKLVLPKGVELLDPKDETITVGLIKAPEKPSAPGTTPVTP